ncbi:hypothetical protein H2199_006468 [Coniosporium tulheliwenetii]|uniref:Uncharacterized protein n=1 Tax=Coniosporium tulheliwenetii TaxID=3383036 RepID=A0ACC2YVQ8_9PEZI|nr:hypothetical protein H2199_006468 [Cladosporium sp. JES 115]
MEEEYQLYRRPNEVLDSDSDEEMTTVEEVVASSSTLPVSQPIPQAATSRTRKRALRTRAPAPIHTPTSPIDSSIPPSLLPAAPASPPTPAPSPTPNHRAPDWSTASEHEDATFRNVRAWFSDMNDAEKERLLGELLNMCNSHQLSFVHDFVSPRLKKDPFTSLPNELCLRILTFIDDPTTLARSSQVSKRWRELVSDDMAWKSLCDKHAYRRLSNDSSPPSTPSEDASDTPPTAPPIPLPRPTTATPTSTATRTAGTGRRGSSLTAVYGRDCVEERGKVDSRSITPDQGVVTSLHLTDKYIVVALDNAKIHVFDTNGEHQKTLQGHVMGVWAMVPWEDVLISGGCDRDVRVWNMKTGALPKNVRQIHRHLRLSRHNPTHLGHSPGVCKHVLVGHQASVRCLEIHGDRIVSGSYDTTARIWSISEGKCLRTLTGHFSQIYAVAFDGRRIATGSLDTSVRIWDPNDGRCLAILQGHTSLVGQLQMRHDILVTGGSDGSVRVWSLTEYQPIHRLAAHDNSVTSLQFDDARIVSGGSDGRVKVWDLKKGNLIRELSQPAEAVWRVVFEEEKAVVMASLVLLSPDDAFQDQLYRSGSPASLPDRLPSDHMVVDRGSAAERRSLDTSDVNVSDAFETA